LTLSINRKEFPVHPRNKHLNRAENDPFTAVTLLNMGLLPIRIVALELSRQPIGLLKMFTKQKDVENFPFEFEATGKSLPVELESKDFWDFGYFHSKLPSIESGALYITIKYLEAETPRQEAFRIA